MKTRNSFVFVFNGFSDWEPALAIAGLQQFTDVEVKTFSVDGSPVRSMGNLEIMPDLSLNEISVSDISMLILPGGGAWDEGENKELLPMITALNEKQIPIAAICGATSFLAQNAFLDQRPHTSNHLELYLKKVAPTYRGDQFYRNEACVLDGNLITANGTAMIPFAEAIFKKFDVSENEQLSSWFQFFIHPETIPQ